MLNKLNAARGQEHKTRYKQLKNCHAGAGKVFLCLARLTTATRDVSKKDRSSLHQVAGKSHLPS